MSLPAFPTLHPSPVTLNYWLYPNLPGFLILRANVYTTLFFWNILLAHFCSFFDNQWTRHLLCEVESDSLPATSRLRVF